MWHIFQKSVSMQQHFEQCLGKQRGLERIFGISEADLLRFNCINLLSPQGQCREQFKLIYVLHILNAISSGEALIPSHTIQLCSCNYL